MKNTPKCSVFRPPTILDFLFLVLKVIIEFIFIYRFPQLLGVPCLLLPLSLPGLGQQSLPHFLQYAPISGWNIFVRHRWNIISQRSAKNHLCWRFSAVLVWSVSVLKDCLEEPVIVKTAMSRETVLEHPLCCFHPNLRPTIRMGKIRTGLMMYFSIDHLASSVRSQMLCNVPTSKEISQEVYEILTIKLPWWCWIYLVPSCEPVHYN